MSFSGRLSFPSQSRKLKKEGLSSHACYKKARAMMREKCKKYNLNN